MTVVLTCKRKRTIDQNHLAQVISAYEGKEVQVNIAQIKEVLGIALDVLADQWAHNPRGVVELLKKHQ